MPIVKVNGVNLNYRTDGEGESLVLISGIGMALREFNRQVPLFKRFYRVIRYDNRGAGKSDKPVTEYSIRDMADDTIGLLDHLGIERASFLGCSMGGLIAQEVAITYPQRVAKLVLCSTFSRHDSESGLTPEALGLAGLPKVKYLMGLLSLVFNSPIRRGVAFVVRALTNSKASETGVNAQAAASARHDAFERLRLIKAPTLILVGAADRLIRPSSSEVLAREIPHARLAKINGGSHNMHVEKSEAFNAEVLSFLQEDDVVTHG